MTVLQQWIRNLGYENQKLKNMHYLCQEDKHFLIPIQTLKLGFNFPREINRYPYIEGMEDWRAKDILNGIFENKYLPAIEIYLKYDHINGYHYRLADGYHRYSISRYLKFSHIPVIIKQKSSY